MADIARFCNRFPNIDPSFEVSGGGVAAAGETVTVSVELVREASQEGMDEGAGLGAVHAPLFPKPKTESYWLAVADAETNALHAIKRLAVGARARAKLEFAAPEPPADGRARSLKLYLMCDSYVGCDQEYDIEVWGGGRVRMLWRPR